MPKKPKPSSADKPPVRILTAAPLTRGQQLVLYILLTTRSQLRFSIEGLIGDTYGSPGTGDVTDLQTLYGRLDRQIQLVFNNNNLDHTSIPYPQLLLPPSPNAGSLHGVTRDPTRIRTAVGMDGIYDPTGDPCPSDYSNVTGTVKRVDDQANMVTGILSKIP